MVMVVAEEVMVVVVEEEVVVKMISFEVRTLEFM
jgi:hypothetical protein